MTSPAVLPGAALRVMRTAAGRRALQVALLVGGLFVLGFLCGEQAQAADGMGLTGRRWSAGETAGRAVAKHPATATPTATTPLTARRH